MPSRSVTTTKKRQRSKIKPGRSITKEKTTTRVNLAKHATSLADINELRVVITILESIPPEVRVPGRLEKNIGEYSKKILSLKKKSNDELESAIETKEKQGVMVGNYIYNDATNFPEITDAEWTNNPTKFKNFCGKEHNNNPADIVIKYKGGLFLGISLKASFGKSDIGQYNSSVCSFINGLIYKNSESNGGIIKNNSLDDFCKSPGAPISHGKAIQNECDGHKERFYVDVAESIQELKIYGDNSRSSDDKKDAYKEYIKDKGNKIIVETMRTNLLRHCRDSYFANYFGGLEEVNIEVNIDIARTIIANYLRLDLDPGNEGQVVPYIKISALYDTVYADDPPTDNGSKAQEDLINKYVLPNQDGNVTINYKKVASGSILIRCSGATKGILCRIKFAGTPPSSFKIDGKNDPIKIQGGGGEEKTESMILLETITTEQLAVLYEIIDSYLQGCDTIDELKEKNDKLNVKSLFNDYQLMLDRSIKLCLMSKEKLSPIKKVVRKLKSMVNVKEFINEVINQYIDEFSLEEQKEDSEIIFDQRNQDVSSVMTSPGSPHISEIIKKVGGGKYRRRRNMRRKNTRRRSNRRGKNTRKKTRRKTRGKSRDRRKSK